MKLLVDGYGADKGSTEIWKGCAQALERHPDVQIAVIGPASLKSLPAVERLSLIETETFISNDEEPAMAVRRKKDASIVMGCRLMETDGYDGLLSAGSTGAMLAAGVLITKRISGVTRAALTVILPTKPHPTVLLDAGANMDASAELLTQFGFMGSLYAQHVLEIPTPLVALLNVGTEPGKGTELTKEAFDLFQDASFSFLGNLEARDLLSGAAQVIVTDGFSGNIALKTLEGTASFVMNSMKEALLSGFRSKLGAALAKPALTQLKDALDYRKTGAAPLLGVRRPIFKAHGSSDADAIANGIDKLVLFVRSAVIEQIEERIVGEEMKEA